MRWESVVDHGPSSPLSLTPPLSSMLVRESADAPQELGRCVAVWSNAFNAAIVWGGKDFWAWYEPEQLRLQRLERNKRTEATAEDIRFPRREVLPQKSSGHDLHDLLGVSSRLMRPTTGRSPDREEGRWLPTTDTVTLGEETDVAEQRRYRARASRTLAELPGLRHSWYHQQVSPAEALPPTPRSWPEFSRDDGDTQRRAELLQRCGEPFVCPGPGDSFAHSSRAPLIPLCGLPEPHTRHGPRAARDVQGIDGVDRCSGNRNKVSLPAAVRRTDGVSMVLPVEHFARNGVAASHLPEQIPGHRLKRR